MQMQSKDADWIGHDLIVRIVSKLHIYQFKATRHHIAKQSKVDCVRLINGHSEHVAPGNRWNAMSSSAERPK